MGMERLLESLRREARERGEVILAEAREEAERVRAEAREEVRGLREDRLARAEAGARQEVEHRVAEARREETARLLEARADALERVFERARERLQEAAADGARRYRPLARADVGRARLYVPDADADAAVRCPPDLVPLLEDVVDDLGAPYRVEADEGCPPGFRVASRDGSVEVDAALTTWLERLRPELSIAVSGRLVG